MQPPILEARGLMKRYGKTQALAGLDLVVSPGRVVALLGPNGAGKTTFVRAVATLLRPDAGTLYVDGIDALRKPAKVRQVVGLAGQFAAVEEAMTGRENLQMVGRLFGLGNKEARAAAVRVLDQMRLTADADRLVRTYSGGMRRRIDLGISLVGTPRLLLLDEPTAGLDPGSRIQLWDVIRSLVLAGTDILLTTQYLDEADALAESVVFIDAGQVVATGTPAEMKAQAGEARLDLIAATGGDLDLLTSALSGFQPERDASACSLSVPVRGTGTAGLGTLSVITEAARHSGARIERFSLREPNLDDAYFQLTGTARPGEARDKP